MNIFKQWVNKSRPEWSKVREQGYAKFMLKTALPWGLFMFVFNAVFQWTILSKPEISLDKFLLVHLVIWSIGGFGFGHVLWKMGERNYRKSLEKENTTTNE